MNLDLPHLLISGRALILAGGLSIAGQITASPLEKQSAESLSLRPYIEGGRSPEWDEGVGLIRSYLDPLAPIDGVKLMLRELNDETLYRISLKAKGSGVTSLALYVGGNLWAYSTPQRLAGEWADLTISRTTPKGTSEMALLILSPEPKGRGSILEIKDIAVVAEAPIQAPDVHIAATSLDPADYTDATGQIVQDADLGASIVENFSKASLKQIPFPSTSLPITLHLRTRAPFGATTYLMVSTRGDEEHVVREVTQEGNGEWQWIRFAPVAIQEIGESFHLRCIGPSDASQDVAVNRLVISTEGNLPNEVLQSVSE